MTLHLALRALNPRLTTLDALQVALRLENRASEACDLPGPDDQSGALSLLFHRPDGTLARTMSGLTHQYMMSSARLDMTPVLTPLGPGEAWDWTLDTAAWHYPLPAGRYQVQARLHYRDAEWLSAPAAIEVSTAALASVSALRDNPVLDGLALLLRADNTWTLRQHNTRRPLAAWYSRVLDPAPPAGAFLASPAFFRTDSFEHFFEKWLIWSAEGLVQARHYQWGRAEGDLLSVPLPRGLRLLPQASYGDGGPLRLFFMGPGRVLYVGHLDSAGLHPLFRQRLPGPANGPDPVVRADCDALHIVTPHAGLHYLRLDHQGNRRLEQTLLRTRLRVAHCELDPERRTVRALFRGGEHDRSLLLVEAGVEPARLRQWRIDDLPVRGALREFAFGSDGRGRFHLLVATSRQRLYYLTEGGAPRRIATGDGPFHPLVSAAGGVYLGLWRPDTGYRFLQFAQRRQGPRVVDFEVLP